MWSIWPISFRGKTSIKNPHNMEISQSWLLFPQYTTYCYCIRPIWPISFSGKTSIKNPHNMEISQSWLLFTYLVYILLLHYTDLTNFFSRKKFHQKSSQHGDFQILTTLTLVTNSIWPTFFRVRKVPSKILTTWFISKIDHFWPRLAKKKFKFDSASRSASRCARSARNE